MSFTVQASNENPFLEEEQLSKKHQEIKNYTDCVSGKPDLFQAITEVRFKYFVHGVERPFFTLPEFRRERIAKTVDKGIKGFLNGKHEFKVGCFGSVWFDYESQRNALTVRVAYYKKRINDKHYVLSFTCEEREVVKCDGCDETSKWFKKCSRCDDAQYCSPECQKKHWAEHKKVCSPKE